MSKLFKLKEWLSVPEAAKHLSVVFSEEVTEAAGGLPQDSALVVRTAALREFEQSLTEPPVINEKPLATTERNNLLKQIAALSLVLAEKSSRYKRGGKPNALQIAEEVVTILEALPDANSRGVGGSSIRESIKEGMELLTLPK